MTCDLSQFHPPPIHTMYFPRNHLNIPSPSQSSKWKFSKRFPQQSSDPFVSPFLDFNSLTVLTECHSQVLACLLQIWEVMGSNAIPETEYIHCGSCGFPQSLQKNAEAVP
jgi:hypothetical protein